jgi:hypothetical protein
MPWLPVFSTIENTWPDSGFTINSRVAKQMIGNCPLAQALGRFRGLIVF